MSDLNTLLHKITEAKTKQDLQVIKSEIFGKNSSINNEFKNLGSLSPEERKIKANDQIGRAHV